MIVQKIAIKEARFFSPIGFYEEERILGNDFEVNLEVSYPLSSGLSDELKDTLNYEQLYRSIQKAMIKERKLLESAAHEILQDLLKSFSFIEEIEVTIIKINPPFGGDLAKAEVALQYKSERTSNDRVRKSM